MTNTTTYLLVPTPINPTQYNKYPSSVFYATANTHTTEGLNQVLTTSTDTGPIYRQANERKIEHTNQSYSTTRPIRPKPVGPTLETYITVPPPGYQPPSNSKHSTSFRPYPSEQSSNSSTANLFINQHQGYKTTCPSRSTPTAYPLPGTPHLAHFSQNQIENVDVEKPLSDHHAVPQEMEPWFHNREDIAFQKEIYEFLENRLKAAEQQLKDNITQYQQRLEDTKQELLASFNQGNETHKEMENKLTEIIQYLFQIIQKQTSSQEIIKGISNQLMEKQSIQQKTINSLSNKITQEQLSQSNCETSLAQISKTVSDIKNELDTQPKSLEHLYVRFERNTSKETSSLDLNKNKLSTCAAENSHKASTSATIEDLQVPAKKRASLISEDKQNREPQKTEEKPLEFTDIKRKKPSAVYINKQQTRNKQESQSENPEPQSKRRRKSAPRKLTK